MIIRICDLDIKLNNKYSFVEKTCKNYLINDSNNIAFEVTAEDSEILKEKEDAELDCENLGYYEATVLFRKLCYKMLDYNGILIHSSVIALDNEAYGFSAPSGTGKSTHTRLWLEYFTKQGRNIYFVNGDKPIYRYFNDKVYACGHPWAGKEGYNTNCIVPLKAMIFLERGESNKIRRLDSKEVVQRIFKQILMPHDDEQVNKTFELLNRIIRDIPFYLLECNISLEAVKVCYEGIKGDKNHEN